MKKILFALSLTLITTAAEARPAKWCGWYMSHHVFGKDIRPLWLARNWAHVGVRANGPSVGAIVVWRNHVGKIVGQNNNGQWLVHSGNDGGKVRTRARSLKGAIAFRWPSNYRVAAR